MKPLRGGGGWKAILYTLRMANRVGWLRLWNAMRSRNTCKTCALGMGGQAGGMVNEGGHFPEVCKKSFQAMVSDMQAGITPDFFGRYGFNELRALSPRELEHCGRIVQPVYAGPADTHYRPVSWDEALDKIAASLKSSGPNHSFFYASGRSSNEAGFLLQLMARVFGTNYVNNCSYYCHQASGVGLSTSVGVSTGTVKLEDLESCDLYILIGGNPASNHPRLLRTLMQIRRNGGSVVSINPLKELGLVNFRVPSDVRSLMFGSQISDLYLQPHIGGDIALLTGVAKVVLERNGVDSAFVENHTEGFAEFAARVAATDWHTIVAESGVSQAEITLLAGMYLNAKNVVIGWTMGITHHLHGVENVHAIVNLALMRGMVGRPAAGLMPIRGHSNVQGIGSVGVTPTLKAAIIERLENRLGLQVPKSPGLDTMACMDAAHNGEMHTALCLGGNLFGSNPDSRYALEALSRIDLVAYMSTTLNTGHAWGRGRHTLILPVLPRDEEPQPTTQESMFSFVRVSDGGPARYRGPRSEVSILVDLAARVLGPNCVVDWPSLKSHAAVRELIADLIPGLEQMREIDKSKKEFFIPGRDLGGRQFQMPNGKAMFHPVAIPELPSTRNGTLRLMTIRSEGQFNTVVYEDEDIYRSQDRRDVILMAQADIDRLGLNANQRVAVRSAAGEMRWQLVRPFDIRAGNAAMYYPESNVLVPRNVDPRSKTPAFKNVQVTVTPEWADLATRM
jgi:molybdopterin-dependent oxidoreductase alpha subunit